MAAGKPDKETTGGKPTPENLTFGEEESVVGGPGKDLVASIFLGFFSIGAMVLSYLLPNPGRFLTAPGVLPFLTGLTLFLMALGLGFSAVRDGGTSVLPLLTLGRLWANLVAGTRSRTGLLIGIVFAYVVLLDFIEFDWTLPLWGFRVRFSSYEAVSIPALTSILRLFWRAPLLRCFLVAMCSVFILAWTFRYGFKILLPGSG